MVMKDPASSESVDLGAPCAFCVCHQYECAGISEFRCGSALAYPGAYSCSPLCGFHVLSFQEAEGRNSTSSLRDLKL